MIINDFHVMRIAVYPAEADSPLIVDPNAILTGAIAREFFQSIAWRHAQVVERLRRI
jgi:hypothetical protein